MNSGSFAWHLVVFAFCFVYSDVSVKRSIPYWARCEKKRTALFELHLTATSTAPPISIVVHSVKVDKKLLWDVNTFSIKVMLN